MDWIRRFILVNGKRYPHEMGGREVPCLPGMRVPVYFFVGTKDVPATLELSRAVKRCRLE